MKKKISYKNNENEWNIKIRQNNRIKGTYREKREREEKFEEPRRETKS